MQENKPSKSTGKTKRKALSFDAEEKINRVKDRSKGKKIKRLTVQHIWEMYSPGPSEVI